MRFVLNLLVEDANSFILGSKKGFSLYANILLEIVSRYCLQKYGQVYISNECRFFIDLSLDELKAQLAENNKKYGNIKPRAAYLANVFINQLHS